MSLRVYQPNAGDPIAAAGPSPALWGALGGCPVADLMTPMQSLGVFHFEDWRNVPADAGFTTATPEWGYLPFFDTSCTIAPRGTSVTSLTKGILMPMVLTALNAQNDQVSLQWNYGGDCVEIDEDMGKLWFEASVQFSSVANDIAAYMVGLAQDNSSVDNLIANNGAVTIADQDFVGFYIDTTDGDALDCIYHDEGTGSGTPTVHFTYATALVAATNYRIGMTYDPEKEEVRYWLNGAMIGTALSIGATGFPNGDELSPIFAVKITDAGPTSSNLRVNWWGVSQLY